MAEVTLAHGDHVVRAQRVYTRRLWSDSWTLQPYLHCLEASWSVAPTISSATLSWKFGDSIKQPDDDEFAQYLPMLFGKVLPYDKYYVKVEFDDDASGIRYWVGILEISEEQLGGTAPYYGDQVITCYGLERLLDSQPVVTTHWRDRTSVVTRVTETAVPFNRNGIGNRTESVFGTSHLFDIDLDIAVMWASRHIVDYLLATQLPADSAGGFPIPFTLNAAVNTIPTWDEPQINPEGQTVYSLLDRIINRHRLLTWHLHYHELGGAEFLYIQVDTLLSASIGIPHSVGGILAANAHLVDWRYDDDEMTNATVKHSDIEKVDQVVCRGARRISVGTFSIPDATMEIGWTTTAETAYEAAASGVSGYSDLSRDQKQKRNAEVRDAPALEDVFATFRIPKTWNRKVKDGIGGTENVFFPVDDSLGGFLPDSAFVYYPTMFIEQTLPLIVGVDYSGSAIPNNSYTEPKINREERAPFVCFKRPGSSPVRWIAADSIGNAADLERVDDDEAKFSCHVMVPNESHAIRVRVTGKPQHAIAETWFTKLTDDPDPGDYDAGDMIVTLAISDDRHVEGVWPATITYPAGVVVKKKYIDCGDKYRKIYVAPETVVGIDTDGSLKRSTNGGFIPSEGSTDDEHKLIGLARMAYEWYGRTRWVLALDTYRMPSRTDIDLGYLVTHVGDPAGEVRQQINSIITQIQIRAPLGAGRAGDPCPLLKVITWAGELDPIQLSPRAAEPVRAEKWTDRYDEQPRKLAAPDRYVPSQAARDIAASIGVTL